MLRHERGATRTRRYAMRAALCAFFFFFTRVPRLPPAR